MKTNRPDLEAIAEQNRLKLVEYFKQSHIHGLNVVRIGYWLHIDGEALRTNPELRTKLKTGNLDVMPECKFFFNFKTKVWTYTPIPHKGKSSGKTFEQKAEKYGFSADRT